MTDSENLTLEQQTQIVRHAMEDLKALEITELDVKEISSIADRMIVCTGTSNRHVKSIADNVVEECKKHGIQPLGVEGKETSEWVLVDLNSIIVHVMLPTARKFYDLERLWEVRPTSLSKDQPST